MSGAEISGAAGFRALGLRSLVSEEVFRPRNGCIPNSTIGGAEVEILRFAA